MTRSRFAQIPVFWIPLLKTVAQWKTAAALVSFVRDEHATVGIRLVAKVAGIHHSSVIRAIKHMEKVGILAYQAGSGRQRSTYFVVQSNAPQPKVTNAPLRCAQSAPQVVRLHAPRTEYTEIYTERENEMTNDENHEPYHHGKDTPLSRSLDRSPTIDEGDYEAGLKALDKLRGRFGKHAQPPVESGDKTGTDA